jgi:hypothetical protein
MIKKNPSLPARPVRAFAQDPAYQLACERLASITDIYQQCRKSGARYLPAEKSVIIDHLNRFFRISFTQCEVSSINNDEPVPLRDKILILHYFTGASGMPLSGKLVPYKELQEGTNNYPTFLKKAIEPIVAKFKDEPGQLLEAAATLGGHKSSFGDVSVTIDAFPYVPLTVVLWRGDKGSLPDANIMFDSTIAYYLAKEDITILCEIIAGKLVKLLKTGGGLSGKR